MGCRTCEIKPKVICRKGLWSPEEDEKLRDYIHRNGHGSWSYIPAKAGLQRNGKSCRLRWLNYLRPGLKHGYFSPEEVEVVVSLHSKLGNKWSQIAMHLPGRTDNEVKNYWNCYLKKKAVKVEGSDHFHASTSISESNQNQKTTQLSEESIYQISFSGCSESMESSSEEDSIQSRKTVVNNCSNQEMNQIPIDKVLFAEWMPVDQAKSQSQMHANIGGLSCQWNSTSNEEINMPSNDHFLNGISNFNNCGEFEPQFNHGGTSSPEGSMFDLFSLIENCSGFQMSHDIIF
ncbi:transcription factor LAF1-like [Canna indica]|uniref:Transcription factor LAF1-like n=1 Tax=Canna indica TaxID=4628 RepID=A0AAQ3QC49_9LILI|nr:transcription factor LAF1-like [Canna indica]